MQDHNVLQQILRATGIPENLIDKEMEALIKKAGLESKDLSLEDIRSILVDYLQEVILEAKTNY